MTTPDTEPTTPIVPVVTPKEVLHERAKQFLADCKASGHDAIALMQAVWADR